MAAILALTSTVSTKWTSPFSHHEPEEDHISLPIKISTKSTGSYSGNAYTMQSLFNAYGYYDQDYINKQLDSYNDIQIMAKIYIGSEKEEFDLIFDSGSAWVWVGGQTCANCANEKKFYHTKSHSFRQKSYYLSTLKYGKG